MFGKRDFKPELVFKKSSISSLYPAKITTKSSLLSSIPLTNVSMASSPKVSCLSLQRAYASSINRTPPKEDFIISLVNFAVCPTY